jgi:Outer membrane protein transport protein (OMPP1/FadL/TodX)
LRASLGGSDVAVAPSLGLYLPLSALPSSERLPYSDRVVFGIGFGAPFAITANWSDAGFQRFNSSNQSLFVLELAPTMAVRISERLSVGATLDWVAFDKLRIDAFLGDGFVGEAASSATGTAVPPEATIDGDDDGTLSLRTDDSSRLGVGHFDSDFGSAGYTLGLRYRLLDELAFGLAYREETPVDFEGDVALRIDPSAGFGALPVHSRSRYRTGPRRASRSAGEMRRNAACHWSADSRRWSTRAAALAKERAETSVVLRPIETPTATSRLSSSLPTATRTSRPDRTGVRSYPSQAGLCPRSIA